jgi:probable rRNA maturation factor
VSFIIVAKAKYADLLLLTIYEIKLMRKELKIRFFPHGLSLSLNNRGKLKSFLKKIIKSKGKELVSVNYIFCSDKELLRLNNEFLNHNYYTDILTFDLSESKEKVIAEIFISLDRVRENASQFKTPIKRELHRVIIHGVLHLCGYSDKTKTEMLKMRKAEDKYLSLYFK